MREGTVLGRLRPAIALVIMSGLLAALFTVCCCLAGEQKHVEMEPGADPTSSSSAYEISTDVSADGHAEPGCDRAAEAAAALPASLHGAEVLSAAAAGDPARPTVEGAIAAEAATPRPAAAHLLCVMRT